MRQDFSCKVGEKIFLLRHSNKMTQKDFGTLLGLDQSQFSKIERGISPITASQLCQIAKWFNINPCFFFSWWET